MENENLNQENNNPTQTPVHSVPVSNSIMNQKGFFPLIFGVIVLLVVVAGGAYYLGTQKNQTSISEQTPSPTSQAALSPTLTPTNKPDTVSTSNFTYNNFSLSYPKDWTLLDMSTNANFPLKQRLSSLYASGRVIALSKQGTNLIITIEKESEGGAGGIFVGDADYNEFISNKDRVNIGNSTFYLNRDHEKSSSLLESHAGPWGWSVLAEYIPSKRTESGNVFRGYENVIKRNGYAYNFIVTSNEGGNTDSQLQKEIIGMLETINW